MHYSNSSLSEQSESTTPRASKVGKSSSANSLSEHNHRNTHRSPNSLDSNSELKRRLTMPTRSSSVSSPSETQVPASKVGKSNSGHALSESNLAHSSKARKATLTGFVTNYNASTSVGDGIRHTTARRQHECAAIISDVCESGGNSVIFKLKCPVGDTLEQRYPAVPNRQKLIGLVSTGKMCLDTSIREISRRGVKCVEHLYKGLHSNIFVGYDDESHRYVAVKLTNIGVHCCKRELRGGIPCTEIKHYAEEIAYLTQFKHPNIISMLGCFSNVYTDKLANEDSTAGKNAILLEFCAHGQLSRLLEKTKVMSEAVAVKYFRQMFSAVNYIHSSGFAVRNISLGHFLLSHSNQIKLIDLSRVFPLAQKQMHYSEGVPGFQAPELLNHQMDSCRPDKADMWALGACLYSMITGNLTTTQHSMAASYTVAFTFPHSLDKILSAEIHQLLAGMLEPLPDYRFTLSRVENSEWLSRTVADPLITGFYLLNHSKRTKLSKREQFDREDMEI